MAQTDWKFACPSWVWGYLSKDRLRLIWTISLLAALICVSHFLVDINLTRCRLHLIVAMQGNVGAPQMDALRGDEQKVVELVGFLEREIRVVVRWLGVLNVIGSLALVVVALKGVLDQRSSRVIQTMQGLVLGGLVTVWMSAIFQSNC